MSAIALLVFTVGACSKSHPKAAGPTSSTTSETSTTAAGRQVAGTTTTIAAQGPQNLVVDDALRAQLLAAYVASTKIPAGELAGTKPGSVYYAYLPSTRTYWAVATFEPKVGASERTQVSMQDGGEIGVFSHPTGKGWTMQSTGGFPFPCAGVLLPELQRLWGLTSPPACQA